MMTFGLYCLLLNSYDEYIDTLSKRLLSPNYILIWSTSHFIYPQLLLRSDTFQLLKEQSHQIKIA
jgi:hypothetical protein